MESKKQTTVCKKQKETHRYREKISGCQWGEGRRKRHGVEH